MKTGEYVPLSHMWRNTKVLMDDNHRKRGCKSTDLRASVLISAASKRQCLAAGVASDEGSQPQRGLDDILQDNGLASAEDDENSRFATDFSDFNKQIRRHEQQHEHDAQQDEEQPKLTRNPSSSKAFKTFDDLTSAPSLQRASTANTDVGNYSLPPCSRSRDAAHASAGGGAATGDTARCAAAASAGDEGAAVASAASASVQFDASGLPAPPWDWSLKRGIRLSCSRPFTCLDPAALLGHVGGEAYAAAGGPDEPQPSLQELVCQAQVHWQHPAQPLPAEALGPMHESRQLRGVLVERALAWREALRALMAALRRGRCPLFYAAGTLAQRHRFAALFCAPGMLGSPCAQALMSRTSRQLRSALEATGVRFSLPLAKESRAAEQGARADGESGAAGVQDFSPASLLVVRGARHVHGLYHALLLQPWCQPGQQDVPSLLAPTPFSGSTCCMLRFKLKQQGAVTSGKARVGVTMQPPQPPQELHFAEAVGGQLTPPWVVHRLFSALAQAQQADFDAHLDTEPSSDFALRAAVPSDETPGDEPARRLRSSDAWRQHLSPGEVDGLMAPPIPPLRGRTVQQLAYYHSERRYSAQLGLLAAV